MQSKVRGRRRIVVLVIGAAIALVAAGVVVGRLVGDVDVSTSFADAGTSGSPSPEGNPGGVGGTTTGTAEGAEPIGTSGAPSAAPGRAPTERTVSVTYAEYDESTSTVQVGAYVSQVVETGGTCAVELAQGARSARADASSVPDAASTSCGDLSVPLAELGPGRWDGFVTYGSSTTTGRSADFVVVVP